MGSEKYVGLDVHKDTISIAVMNSAGKLIMESIIETKAITILQFFQGLQGDVYVTFEEGTWAAWLYDLWLANGYAGPILAVIAPRKGDASHFRSALGGSETIGSAKCPAMGKH